MKKAIDNLRKLDLGVAGTGIRLFLLWSLVFLALILCLYLLSLLGGLFALFPTLVLVACGVLLAVAFVLTLTMLQEQRFVLRTHQRFRAAFDSIRPLNRQQRAHGLPAERLAEIRAKAELLRGQPRQWWLALEEALEAYTDADGREGWYLTSPVSEILTEDELIFKHYHASFHQAVPNILTALGLLATFVAILQALGGVTYNPQDAVTPVTGMDTLINGLAGKFFASIVALILSVLFTFAERKICERRISEEHSLLIERCSQIFPYLTPSRILLDIQRLLAGQTRAASSRSALVND